MATRTIGTREEWLAARLDLLQAEKELTRKGDEVTRRRMALPWVKVNKEYRFETEDGTATLADLFAGRSQLLVYHFMLGKDYKAGCPSCSSIADGFNGIYVHLENHDVTLTAVSRAPFANIQAYKKRMEWSFPWSSSHGTEFNADFHVGFTDEEQRLGLGEYNFRPNTAMNMSNVSEFMVQIAASCGTVPLTFVNEMPGMSAFVLEDGIVYHTYSTYARGLDGLWNMYQWLDRAPKGRNEESYWLRRHDEYGA